MKMGFPWLHSAKEGWPSQMAIRLQKIKHTHHEKTMYTAKDERHHAQEREVHLLHKDRPLHDVPLLHAVAKKSRDLCDLN